MRPTHFTNSAKAAALASNPIAKAVAAALRAQAQREFVDQIMITRMLLLSIADGDDATDILARLAVVIGTQCEAGVRLHGHEVPWVRQLHGALRTIQSMCLDGYRWQAKYALAMDRAVEVAAEPRPEFNPDDFKEAWLGACAFATDIANHIVSADAIKQ